MSTFTLAKLARFARVAAPLAVGLGLSAPMAAQAATYITTFQGATFTVTQNSSTDFTFDILGANALTGDWTGAQYLGAFAFTDISPSGTMTATLIDPATGQAAAGAPGGLNANGCDGAGASFVCFDFLPNIAVAPELKFDISTVGGAFNFASTGPDLKILWTNSSTVDTHVGSLFSAPIPLGTPPVVPEPATWGMMIVGIGAIGATLRIRRKAQQRLALPA